jgi:hypothetical protein
MQECCVCIESTKCAKAPCGHYYCEECLAEEYISFLKKNKGKRWLCQANKGGCKVDCTEWLKNHKFEMDLKDYEDEL